MTRVVVDASVLLAALMADGTTRHAILHTSAVLYVPQRIVEEARRNMPKVADRTELPEPVLRGILNALLDRFEIVPDALIEPTRAGARELVEAADAPGDEDYVALASALDAPIWTLDRDFDRIPQVETLDTRAFRELD